MRTISDVFYTFLAWLPFVAIIMAIIVYLLGGLAQFEAVTTGTDFFVPR